MGWPCAHCPNGWFCVPPLTIATIVTICTETASGITAAGLFLSREETTSVLNIETTSTTYKTVLAEPSPIETFHPATAGWSYGGCFKDDDSRSLRNASITGPIVGGMAVEICITYCKTQGFGVAGAEGGHRCFCGDVLYDSEMVDESECNMPCTGDPDAMCGGHHALSMWSYDGKILQDTSPEHDFVMPVLQPGQTELSVNEGGVRMTVIKITTPVYAWPPMARATTTPAGEPVEEWAKFDVVPAAEASVATVDPEGLSSTVQSMVSAAMEEARVVAAPEIAKLNSDVQMAKSVVRDSFDKMAAVLSMAAKAFPDNKGALETSCTATTVISSSTTACTSTGVSIMAPQQQLDSESTTRGPPPLQPPEAPRNSSPPTPASTLSIISTADASGVAPVPNTLPPSSEQSVAPFITAPVSAEAPTPTTPTYVFSATTASPVSPAREARSFVA